MTNSVAAAQVYARRGTQSGIIAREHADMVRHGAIVSKLGDVVLWNGPSWLIEKSRWPPALSEKETDMQTLQRPMH